MSDDEFSYDENDEFYIDPYNEAEDLAAHAVHSPVWVEHSPDWDALSVPSDWEYHSDDYWDYASSASLSRKTKIGSDRKDATTSSGGVGGTPKTRKRLNLERRIPKLSLGEPTVAVPSVIWKSKSEMFVSSEGSTITGLPGEKVSLLADWRERFGIQPKTKPRTPQYKGNQRVLAVAVDGDHPVKYIYDTSMPPLTSFEDGQGLPSRHGPSPLAGQKVRDINGVEAETPCEDDLMQKLKSKKLSSETNTHERKRKANDQPSDNVLVEVAAKTPSGRLKKQKIADEKRKGATQPLSGEVNGTMPMDKEPEDDRTAVHALTSTTRGIASSRKRKIVEASSEDDLARPASNRKTDGKRNTATATGSPTERPTPRARE